MKCQSARPGLPPASHSIKFGLLTNALATLEKNPLWETVTKDVLGFNVPKIAVTRTPKERLDVATLELSNTGITVGSSLLFPPIIRKAAQKLSGVAPELLSTQAVEALPAKAKLARLGASFGFLFPFASAFWSAVFFRNWLTVKRTNIANFEHLVGLDQGGKKARRSPQEEMAYQLGMAKKVLAVGATLGAGALLGFSRMAKNFQGKALSPVMENLFHKFHLGGKKADQLRGRLSTFLFWLAPAYLGWLHAARGKNEFVEQAVKAVNGVMWFSLFTPMLDKFYYKKKFETLLQRPLSEIPGYADIPKIAQGNAKMAEQLTRLKNKQFGIGMAITILMLSTTPQLLNIFLTKRRHEQEKQAKSQGPASTQLSPYPFPGSISGPPLVRNPQSPFAVIQQQQFSAQRF